MLQKTRGIVLHVTNYSESSVVAKMYTGQFGMQSYLINSVRSKKAKVKANILQPLTLVELVAYHKDGKGLQRIKEIIAQPQLATIPYDVIKSTVAIFMNEVIYKSIIEEEANENLFHFLFHAIQILDLKATDCSSFHLYFMIQFTKPLGFYPEGEYTTEKNIFNLKDGKFQKQIPDHPYFIERSLCEKFYGLLKSDFENYNEIKFSAAERKELLGKLILYFELHHTHGSKLQSHKVLEEVMHG